MTGRVRSADIAIEAARRLRAVRQAKGLSQKAVEEMTGGEFGQVVLTHYENGLRVMSLDRIVRLCEAYGVSLYDVLPPGPLVSSAFAAITAAKEAEKQAMAITYEKELADLRARMHLEAMSA